MGRPAGHKLNRAALEDILRLTGISVTRLAELADVPRSTISALQGQHHGASIDMAAKIARALDVKRETLFPSLIEWADEEASAVSA